MNKFIFIAEASPILAFWQRYIKKRKFIAGEQRNMIFYGSS